MKPTGEHNPVFLPPALLAEVKALADADAEHPSVDELVSKLVRRGLDGRVRDRTDDVPATAASSETSPTRKRTPAEAGARLRELRKGRFLPEGETIRSMIEYGRA